MTSRRHFLTAGLGAAAPCLAVNRIGRARLSAITDEIANSPAGAIEFARLYRLGWLELRGVPGARGKSYAAMSEGELRAAARELSEHGVKVSFLNSSLLKHMLPGTQPASPRHHQDDARVRFEGRLDALRRALEAAHIFGVNKIRTFTFSRVNDPLSLLPRLADILGEMAEISGRENVYLLIENEASCNIATCAEMAGLLHLLPSKWIEINWDPLNGTRFQEAPFPDGYAKLPRERIGNVQIKGKSVLPYPERLDWGAIFAALARDAYRGQCGLETHIFDERLIEHSHAAMKVLLEIVGEA